MAQCDQSQEFLKEESGGCKTIAENPEGLLQAALLVYLCYICCCCLSLFWVISNSMMLAFAWKGVVKFRNTYLPALKSCYFFNSC